MVNYYDLSGASTRISWYPEGVGEPLGPGQSAGPVLVYSSAGFEASVSGDDLAVGAQTPAGTLVVAVVKKSGIVLGATVSFALLVPDVIVEGAPVPVQTVGVLSVHRGTAQLGPGQLETYTEVALRGSASQKIFPLVSGPFAVGASTPSSSKGGQ